MQFKKPFVRQVNHFGLSDIENALGLSSIQTTAQNAQQAVNTLNPLIQKIQANLPVILVGWFLLTVLAVFIGSKLAK